MAREVEAARSALGSPTDIAQFVRSALEEMGGAVVANRRGFELLPEGLPVGMRDALGRPEKTVEFAYDLPAPRHASVLVRTDPRVNAIARYVLDGALDPALPESARPARRCGVIVSTEVDAPTVALLVRFRAHLTLPGRDGPRPQVAEEARVVAFTGTPAAPRWLERDEVERLLAAKPSANVPADVARNTMANVLDVLPRLTPHLESVAEEVANELRDADRKSVV